MNRRSQVLFRIIDLLVILAMTFGAPMSALAAPSPTGATIASDLADYPPGATVTLTGAGWAIGESVHIFVNDDAGQTWNHNSSPDPVADGNGAFTYQFQLPDWFVATYTVTATGATSGTATTAFTDNDTYDWAQCKNDSSGGSPISGGTSNDNTQDPCQWVNGNLGANNSIYTEGDVVPQRAIRTVAATGSHSITFDHSFFQAGGGGTYTYDFFATPDYTLGGLLAACNDVPSTGNFAGFDNTGCLTLLGAKSTVPIPSEASYPTGVGTYTYPHMADAEANAAIDGVTRDLWISCGHVSGGSLVADSCGTVTLEILGHGAGNGNLLSVANQTAKVDSYTQMKVSFTTSEADSFVAIWFGGHLAKTSFWDALSDGYKDQGAAFAAGSSFHERIIADETGSVGNRDNQLQSGVVVPPGTITIVKDDLTNSSTSFPFTADPPLSPSNFNLCDPSVTGCSSSQTFSSLPTGNYTVNEIVPSNWTLSNLVCTGGASSFVYTSTGVTITLQPGDNVTCTFEDSLNVVSPAITTIPDPSSGTVGVTLNDTATLSGGNNPTGSITFNLYGPGDTTCSGPVLFTQNVTVNGNGNYNTSGGYLTTATGTYRWTASYSGDSLNNPASSGCDDEQVTVNQGTSTVTTTLHNDADDSEVAVGSSVPMGTSMHDLATVMVSGGPAPTGSVSFTFFNNNSCEGEGSDAGTVALVDNVAHPSDAFGPLAAGSYSFQATWAGDSNYSGNTSACEDFTVNQGTSTVTTTLHDGDENEVAVGGSVALGTSMHDLATVTVSGSFAPTGNVSFTFFNNNSCEGEGTAAGTVALDGNNPGVAHPSNSFGPLASGTYSFQAAWDGDGNYSGATSACEPFTVNQGTSTVTTTLHKADHSVVPVDGSVPLGTIMHDLATITVDGPFAPAGVISFNFYPNGSCEESAAIHAGNVFPDGNNPGVAHPSFSFGPLTSGTYSFFAYWSGDDNYPGTTSACEPFTVNQGTSTVTTTLHKADESIVAVGGSVALGTVMHDSASVTASGSFAPTGDVSFTFYANNACEGHGTAAGTVALDDSGVAHPSDSTSALAAGSYSFQASWAGDVNYAGATSDCEPFTVNKAQLTITTTVHGGSHTDITNTSVPLGTSAHDNATVTGAVAGFPIPAISFTFQNAAIANGSTEAGFDATSIDTGPLGAGNYVFNASVAGDDNYFGDISDDEPFTVEQGTSTVTTTLHKADHSVVAIGGSVALGTIMHDLATVTVGGTFAPTGSVSFTFFNNGTCEGTGTAAGSVALVGNVAHPSSSFGPLQAGSYSFQASWAGNTNYTSSTSDCEPFTVNQGTSTVTTTLHKANHYVVAIGGSVPLGTIMHDSATVSVSSSFAPTGSVNFTFFNNNSCTGEGSAAGTVAIVGGVAHPSNSTAALATGSYSFQASWSGDGNYSGDTSDCEPFTVNTAPTTTTTTAQYNGTKIYRGIAVTDTATVTGAISGFPLTGSVTFFLCSPAEVIANGGNCSSNGTQVGSAVALDLNGQATSASTTNTNTDGLYCWRAVYSPGANTNYTGSSELTSTNECFTVASATIIVQKIIKPVGALTSFVFNVTGPSPYTGFSLSGGSTNTQAGLNAGNYSVTELVPLGWVLTGIGGAPEPNPFNCTVTGSGGSTGVGDLNTQKATITLQLGDTVTCVFENTGQGVTRTQGFWATHPQLAQIAWFGGTAFGHTFPGVVGTAGIGDRLICGRALEGPGINDISKVMGGFWSDVSKTSTGAKRSALDQARMQLLQQLLAAELNASAFGTVPSSGSFAAWETALCGTNQNAIKTAQQQAASFNTAGDSGTFTPGTSAQSKYARSIADIPFWNKIAPPF